MTKQSAGVVVYRFGLDGRLEVLIGHMGGPFWKNKDDGGYSVIKGEVEELESDLTVAAKREFREETGISIDAELAHLGEFKQPSGKVIHVWACEQEIDLSKFKPGEFEMEWPRGSGKLQRFPELDRIEWHTIPTAKRKVVKGQITVFDTLTKVLNYDSSSDPETDSDPQGSLF